MKTTTATTRRRIAAVVTAAGLSLGLAACDTSEVGDGIDQDQGVDDGTVDDGLDSPVGDGVDEDQGVDDGTTDDGLDDTSTEG